jgi:tripartite ATP-independent transporter DctM subunit
MDVALPQAAEAPIGPLSRLDRAVTTALSWLSSLWIVFIMLLICADVVCRNLLNRPISGVTEFVALSIAACVFLVLPSAIAGRRLIRSEIIIEALEARSPRGAAVLDLAFSVVGAFVLAKILMWAWPDFVKAWTSAEFAGAKGSYEIPVWPFKLALISGAAWAIVQLLRIVALDVRTLITGGTPAIVDVGPAARIAGLLLPAVVLAGAVGFVAFMFSADLRSIEIAIYCLLAMLVLVLVGMPIPLALMGVSYIGVWLARGSEQAALNTLGQAAATAVSSYEFSVVPLFIMMGIVLEKADVGRDAFKVAATLMRKVLGGLGIATVFANAVFAAIVGSSVASAAVFSRIAVPEMVGHGYTKRFSVGCVAGSSVLGMLIPPSLLLIIYGLVAEESVGKLFIAAVIPGLLLAGAFAGGIWLMARLAPAFVYVDGKAQTADDIEAIPAREMLTQLCPIVLLIVAVIGGIYGGVFTPTEAAAVGTAFSLVIAGVKGRLNGPTLKAIVLETGFVSAVILFLIVAANLYTRQIAMTGMPTKVADWVGSAGLGMTAFLSIYFVIVFLLGCIIDSVSIMLIVLPIMLPVLELLEGNKIWFGIVTTIAVEIGLLTPPFGLSVYVVKGVLPKDFVTLPTVFAGAFPFVAVMIAVTVLVMAFPGLSLWLVR